MKDIPAIGQTKGIFDVFVPGVFLLLNIIGALYVWAVTHKAVSNLLGYVNKQSAALSLILIISLGYMLGMVLRTLMASRPDKVSAWVLKWRHKYIYKFSSLDLEKLKNDSITSHHIEQLQEIFSIGPYFTKKECNIIFNEVLGKTVVGTNKEALATFMDKAKHPLPWITEPFPYIHAIGEINEKFIRIPSVREFYRDVWKPQTIAIEDNRRFFNFCKMLIYSENDVAMAELVTAEAMIRYMSGMFYALTFSLLPLIIAVLTPQNTDYRIVIICLLILYFLTLWGIMIRYRVMRLWEVQLLFDASYRNREIFSEQGYSSEKQSLINGSG